MDSDISVSYIEKSLSGITNKVPLTQKQKEEELNHEGEIDRFYKKKYKITKFKGFDYTEEVNKTNFELPSVSNFLSASNAQ